MVYIQCSEASRLDGHCSVLEVELRTELGHVGERGLNIFKVKHSDEQS